ncbi:MAG TPA: phosphopantetheine-binding protein [Symbiobacteriaceae bacterium]|nr:phosphopantetheine-binding protein [Symbiobacteriaceae bacterium]
MEEMLVLEQEVRQMIVTRLGLEIDPESVDVDSPIFASFGEGLNLDSIDALELVVALNESFGVKVSDEDMSIFRSVRTIADFIREQRGE